MKEGSVAQRLDASGTVVSSDLYDAYGNKLAGNPNSDPYGYNGQWGYYTDSETGLALCTYRYYDPSNGRWVTRDPIGYAGGINLYGYVRNNPENRIDPSGRKGYWEYEKQYLNCMKDCLKDEVVGSVDLLATGVTALVTDCFVDGVMITWVECAKKIGIASRGLATGVVTKRGLTLFGQSCLVAAAVIALLKCTKHCYDTLLN